jgi:hypothetical protein
MKEGAVQAAVIIRNDRQERVSLVSRVELALATAVVCAGIGFGVIIGSAGSAGDAAGVAYDASSAPQAERIPASAASAVP